MPRRSIPTRFQALFRLPSEDTFQRSFALLFAIGLEVYLALAG